MGAPMPYDKGTQAKRPMFQVQAFLADRCFCYEMDAEELAEWLQWDDAACFDRILVDGVEV